MANEKGVAVGDLVVIMLDRPRHDEAMAEIRDAGARIRLIPHGDVSAALVAVTEDSSVDLLYGIGGTPEGVLAAAAIKCTGGQIVGRLWPRSDEERRAALEAGYDLDEVLDTNRLVSGEDVYFAATGVTSGEMLDGVHYIGREGAITESISMRSRSGTVRTITARHDRAKLREITSRRWARATARAQARGRLEVEVGQRAQERVGHDHVDAQLGLVVDAAARSARTSPSPRSAGRSSRPRRRSSPVTSSGPPSSGVPFHGQTQVALGSAAGGRHQQALLDRPAHRAAVRLDLVLGLAEAQEHERPAENHHLARVVGVDDAQDARARSG